VHARAFTRVPQARVCGVVSRDRARGETFAAKHDIPRVYPDHRSLLNDRDLDVICIGLPNDQHERVVLDAAAAGKHVICEKPLATNLEQALAMIDACKNAGVMLALAEQVAYAPALVQLRDRVRQKALGRIFHVHQRHQHGGPHSTWFWNRAQAGGGALMDMGCHSIEAVRFVLDYPRAEAVYARLSNRLHPQSELEDHATVIIEFEGGAVAVLEPSWAVRGEMVSRIDVFGTEGVLHTDLERRDPDADWLSDHGYPQAMAHFIDSARRGAQPRTSGENALIQLELCYAAYESAASGCRIELPFRPPGIERAVDLWLRKAD
jgi:myo-inositol 2-dehydrogenase/D-chiro-inositol 1-dehydrogenase